MHNFSYGKEFDFQENEGARKTHFHMKGCAPRLVLKQRRKATRKWPIKFPCKSHSICQHSWSNIKMLKTPTRLIKVYKLGELEKAVETLAYPLMLTEHFSFPNLPLEFLQLNRNADTFSILTFKFIARSLINFYHQKD